MKILTKPPNQNRFPMNLPPQTHSVLAPQALKRAVNVKETGTTPSFLTKL
jgi:hypothetical protein